jgi:type VI secretion system protein ImpL
MLSKKDTPLPKSDRQSQALQNIKTKIRQAIASWKKNVTLWQRLTLSRQPWVFLMGSAHVGKTSLLAHCALKFQSSHSSKINPSKPTRHLEFWSSGHHLFVDIPGDWFSATEGSPDEQRFHYFLQLTNTYRSKKAPTTILHVIDFHKMTISDQKMKNHEFELITKQLQFMHDWNNKAEITLIINKADCIPGFQPFFSHLSQEEKKKPCGVGLDFNEEEPILDSLTRQLNAFGDQINAQTIQKLHRERNLSTRDSMKNFPFQVQRLLEEIIHLLEVLPAQTIRSVKGIYFSSCAQSENVSTLFQEDESDLLPIQLSTGSKKKQVVYFIEQLFLTLTKPKGVITTHKLLWRGEYNQIALAFVVLAAAIFSLHIGYDSSKQTLTQLNESLISESGQAISALPKWLNDLNRLEYIRESLVSHKRFDASFLGLTTVRSLSSSTQKVYQEWLNQRFRNYILTQITDQLTQDVANRSPSLFYDLATYLRITQDNPSATEITPWFNQFWSSLYPRNPTEVSLLVNNLTVLLTQKPHYVANQNLIAEAQKIVEESPPSQIIFMMLTTQLSQTKEAVDINQPASITEPMLSINPLFSLDRYNQIVTVEIPRLAKQLTKDNWVLNKPLLNNISPTRSKELIDSAQNLYLTAFSKNWQDAFNHLNINQTTTLNADLELSSYLSSFDSDIWQKLQAVINFMLSKDELDINDKKYWAQIRDHLSSNSNQKLFIAALNENAGYIRKILYADMPEQVSFQESQQRMMENPESSPLKILLTLGKISPEPLSIWLNTLSQQTWMHMLQLSANYIDAGWGKTIYTQYVKTIQNRYPIFIHETSDISISDFNAFFGIDGAVQQFYNNYLNGFIDTDKAYWTLKSLDGQTLPIDRSSLDAIIRGSLIQKMFYQNSKTSPTLGFSLTPITFSKNLKDFILNISGQAYTANPSHAQPFQGTWPGPDGNSVTMHLITHSDETETLTKTGPWAWLRLLQNQQIQPSENSNEFTVIFDLAGQSATFKLTADNRINPYLPGLLDNFRLSENLSTQPNNPNDSNH